MCHCSNLFTWEHRDLFKFLQLGTPGPVQRSSLGKTGGFSSTERPYCSLSILQYIASVRTKTNKRVIFFGKESDYHPKGHFHTLQPNISIGSWTNYIP